MKSPRTPDDIVHSIAQVERRIELRRARLARHAEELRETAQQKAKPLALVGVAAVAVAGFFLGRGPARPTARSAAGLAAKTGFVAAVAAALQTALSIATNPLVRSAWRSYTRKRV
jgi:peptidoglycan/LPS O-acetylase OafA/YrhL